ncbi:hypothetical protein LCGC14_2303390 [marine sediment metagenome]|uniref:Uncharacterized protein n=1 Tax=marine sediment metagenome TaxID=412755 RepID=A0A0F9F055_9ZZZZ
MGEVSKFLTDDEVEDVIMALAHGWQGDGFDEEQARKAVSWAETVRLDAGLLQGVLDGTLHLNIRKDGEIMFKAASTKEGGTDHENHD